MRIHLPLKLRAALMAALVAFNGLVSLPSKAEGADALVLSGDGIFENGASLFLPGNVSIGSGWTGMVKVTGVAFSGSYYRYGCLEDLANGNSWVGLESCTGFLYDKNNGGSVTISRNIEFVGGEAAALVINNGNSNGTATYTGSVRGTGNIEVKATDPNNMGSTFTGDVSAWTGMYIMDAGLKTNNLKFTGTSDVGASMVVKNGTLTVTVGGGDKTLSGTIACEGGNLNLMVEGGGVKTFTKDVSVTQLITAKGTGLTFEGTTTIGALGIGDTTITNKGDMTVTDAFSRTLANTNLEIATDKSKLVKADGATESGDGNGFMSSGFFYVVKSVDSGTLTISEDLIKDDVGTFSLSDGSLLMKAAGGDDIYYINNSITFQNSDAENVAAGKTIFVTNGADLKLTDSAFTSGVIVKTGGAGTVTLDVNKNVSRIDNIGVLATAGTSIGNFVLAEGTKIEFTGSAQRDVLARATTITVMDGASFSARLTNETLSTNFVISGNGLASDGDKAAAVMFGDTTWQNANIIIGGKTTMAGDATVWVEASRTGSFNGEFTGNGHTLVKTGAGALWFGIGQNSPVTGDDHILDANLHIKEGSISINFSNAGITAESRKIGGKVTVGDGAMLNIYDGHTELTGGLAVNGSVNLNTVWAKGLTLSSLIEGGDDAVIHFTRTGTEAFGTRGVQTAIVSADNSEGFSGTYSVDSDWILRADNTNAFAKATVKLDSAGAKLAFGGGISTVKLAGLTGENADATVTGSGTLEITGSGDYVYAGAFDGLSGVAMSGTGKQTMTQAVTGVDISVSNGGTLAFSETICANNVQLAGGNVEGSMVLSGSLGGYGVLENLTLQDGAGLWFDLQGASEGALLTIAGTLVQDGGISIHLTGDDVLPGLKVALMDVADFNRENWNDKNVTVVGPSHKWKVNWVDNVLYLETGPASKEWSNASGDGIWNTTSANWLYGDVFAEGMDARFGDIGSGTVSIYRVVKAGDVHVVNSEGHDYTFTGGYIQGNLYKDGAGTLTLANANLFSEVEVRDGVLRLERALSLGKDATVTLTGGTLDLGGTACTNAVTATGGTITGASAYNGDLVINGDVSVNGALQAASLRVGNGTLQFDDSLTGVDLSLQGNAVITGSCLSISGGIAVSGTGNRLAGFSDISMGNIQGTSESCWTLSYGSSLSIENNEGVSFTQNSRRAVDCVGTMVFRSNGIISFSGNSAPGYYGAAICCSSASFTGNGDISFENNVAGSYGGAIYNRGTLEFASNGDVTFSGNTASSSGGAIYSYGTLEFASNGNITFSGNTASFFGGAIANSWSSRREVLTFNNNGTLCSRKVLKKKTLVRACYIFRHV